MKKTISAIRLTMIQILKAGLGVFAFTGVLPTPQASTKIDLVQVQRMEDIRLRLRETDRLANENPHPASGLQSEEHVASWYDIFDWPVWTIWNNGGNGWRNY